MDSIQKCDLPEGSLLLRYRENGAYTDCYSVEVNREISQAEYIRAFYTTIPFKLERFILKWAVSKPSTDEEVGLLAEAKTERFAAWYVEERQEHQILLSDYRDRTRSWLMSKPSGSEANKSTQLYFGSAVVPASANAKEKQHKRSTFSVLLQFHKLYSRILLSSARSQLI